MYWLILDVGYVKINIHLLNFKILLSLKITCRFKILMFLFFLDLFR